MSTKAEQIVSAMLEDHAGDAGERPGSPGDPWRKGGHAKFDIKNMVTSGKRLGDKTPPVRDDDEDDDAKPAPPKAASRFKWKPQA